MSMDTPSEASGALDTVQAASELAKLLDPQPQEQPKDEEPAAVAEPVKGEDDKPGEEPAKEAEAAAEPEKVTIEVDGKTVELTKAELAEAYKSGLRQADYTKKTMEVSEQRKAAEAEAAKAREERQQLSEKLNHASTLLQAQLQEQSQIDWHNLRETDPNEFLKQWHLYTERQAHLQRIVGEQRQLHVKAQAEQADQVKRFLSEQQEQLLAKLPEWKDEAKAKAERSALRDYLKTQGLEEAQIDNISDHRVVLLSRKAMLYDQMMQKATQAAKAMEKVPPKVERPGGGESNALDGRTKAMQRLSRSGKVEDAAAVFANLL